MVLATFQGLSNHLWLVAVTVDSASWGPARLTNKLSEMMETCTLPMPSVMQHGS